MLFFPHDFQKEFLQKFSQQKFTPLVKLNITSRILMQPFYLWSFKNLKSHKIVAEFHGSHSLVSFLAVMVIWQSRFFHKAVSQSQLFFFKAKKAAKYQIVYLLYYKLKWHLNIIEPEHLEVAFKRGSHNWISQNVLGLQKKC